MELNEIISVVEEKATMIANEEIAAYTRAYPELNLTEAAKTATLTRAISQLTLQLSKFHFQQDSDLDEQFKTWFEKNEEEDLRKTCRHCIEDEAKKIRNANGQNLSSLDAYLKKHLGDIHQVD